MTHDDERPGPTDRSGPPDHPMLPDRPAPTDRQSLRLFVAVELSEVWRTRAEELARQLRLRHEQGYRWVRPELYHVTVVFLGEHPVGRMPAIAEALHQAVEDVRPFELTLGALSAFGVDVPRALILTVEDRSAGLATLRRRLDTALAEREIPYDRKPLRPHITLARARDRGGRDRDNRPPLDTMPNRLASDEPLRADSVALVRSDLHPAGPRYVTIERAGLTGV